MRFYKKRIITICLLIICIISLSGCNGSKFEYSLKFQDFGKDFLINGNRIELPSGQIMTIGLLNKEDSYSPRVILTVDFLTDSDIVKWKRSSTETKIKDLDFLGEKVVEFAKSESWVNNYYLYIKVWLLGDFQDEIYDYEESLLYLSEYDEIIMEMYNKFDSIKIDEVAKTQKGIEYLVQNNLGKIVHGEFEKKWMSSFSIYIIDGEYKEYSRDKAVIAN